jgi:uncharacterized protein (TIGR04141 family)
MAKKMRLSWFLVKPGLEDDVTAVIEQPSGGALHSFKVSALSTDRDSLYVKPSYAAPPRWRDYVSPHVDGGALSDLNLFGASSSGVLLVPASSRLLVVSFGYGRHLVRSEAVVPDFGLKVVLNEIDPELIKSVDARTFDELTINTRQGASRDSSLGAFSLDNSRDLLRSVTGRSNDGGLGALTGSAALAMNTELQLPKLPILAEELVTAFESDRYRENFEFIDHMRGVQDPDLVAKLDDRLVAALKAEDMTNMHLAIPEAVDWQQIAGVRFSLKRNAPPPTPDPRISAYRELRKAEKIDLKRLKTDKVEAISAVDENEIVDRWSVYNCLVFETEIEGKLYILSGGDWYQIDKNYRDKVQSYVEKIPKLELDLPGADREKSEAAFNEDAAAVLGGLCLDGNLVGVGGVDRVEICDILTKDGHFLHVKKRGRSSTLSHLFAQGVTSAELLLRDETFRVEVAAKVKEVGPDFVEAIPTGPGEGEKIRVAYVILSRAKRKDRPYGLPFFSMVSLKAAAERLVGAGVEVRVREVKEA